MIFKSFESSFDEQDQKHVLGVLLGLTQVLQVSERTLPM